MVFCAMTEGSFILSPMILSALSETRFAYEITHAECEKSVTIFGTLSSKVNDWHGECV